MKNFIRYDAIGKILSTGTCQDHMIQIQAKSGEFVLEGEADDAKQKIIDGKVVNKTEEEIDAEKPPVIPESEHFANVTNKDWDELIKRVENLEKLNG